MSEFDRDDYSAIVNCAKFPAKLDQRRGEPFAQTRSNRIRIAQKHQPPLPYGRFQELTQMSELHPEQRLDELGWSEGGNRALGERVASELPPIVSEQSRCAEDLTRRDQPDEHRLAAIQDTELRDAGVQNVNAIRFVAGLEDRATPRDAMSMTERDQSLQFFFRSPRERRES